MYSQHNHNYTYNCSNCGHKITSNIYMTCSGIDYFEHSCTNKICSICWSMMHFKCSECRHLENQKYYKNYNSTHDHHIPIHQKHTHHTSTYGSLYDKKENICCSLLNILNIFK